MPKIFISHVWEDNEISRKLAKQLRRDGAEVWIYYAQIEAGDFLPAAFSNAIEWCDIVILVWSKTASTAHCVQLEWQNALDLKKTIIICLLDDTRQSPMLRGCLFVNLNDFNSGYDNLAHLLNLNLNNEEQPKEPTIENAIIPESTKTVIRLREKPEKLGEAQVEEMIKKYDFFDMKRNANGHGLKDQLEIRQVNGDKVIFDPGTGLIWQNGGSSNSMWYEESEEWIKELNRRGYAGYNDWRLPTLEEGMSLMRTENTNDGLYVDPLFDKQQLGIWTSDIAENAYRAWVVFFNYGSCHINFFDFNNFVRAVRSENL